MKGKITILNWSEKLKKIKFTKGSKTKNNNQKNEDQIWKNNKLQL